MNFVVRTNDDKDYFEDCESNISNTATDIVERTSCYFRAEFKVSGIGTSVLNSYCLVLDFHIRFDNFYLRPK